MIKVVRGNPTPEELAAALTVLMSAAGTAGTGPAPRPAGAWGSPRSLLRTSRTYGPAGWHASALPL
ncbi:acyl-CoA carboxylase subunit epsilon [Streptomyces sp. H51]|uniref:acyl-CoA carboxylase subunit epsilon n=1 Tax=Streptomyces sp. H51 TaxID=3111770 RepID=UPI002D78B53F|nr:acyl-CoA carboxylase subunit epsilon [Streptomyces sp. H51]